jgi:hypothetical protein
MQFDRLKRREFIRLLGSSAVAWPFTAHAQQSKPPTIGFLGTSTSVAMNRWVARSNDGATPLVIA